MRKRVAIAFILVLAGIVAWYAYQGMDEEARIKHEIAEANHCETAADCRVVTGQCPLGCWIAVHKDEAERIEARLASYQSNCVYSCIRHEGAECTKGACEVKLEQ